MSSGGSGSRVMVVTGHFMQREPQKHKRLLQFRNALKVILQLEVMWRYGGSHAHQRSFLGFGSSIARGQYSSHWDPGLKRLLPAQGGCSATS